MTDAVALLQRAHEGLRLHISGEPDAARRHLGELWAELGEQGHPTIRCSVAHYLADLQGDDVQASLRWNLLALSEADRAADPDEIDPELGVSVRQLYPSLLLNVAEDYRRLGDSDAARAALAAARAQLERLDSDYRQPGLAVALDDLEGRLTNEPDVE